MLKAAIIGNILFIFLLDNYFTNSPLTTPKKTRKIKVIILINISAVDWMFPSKSILSKVIKIIEYKKPIITENKKERENTLRKSIKETFKISGLPIDPQSLHLIPT